MGFARRVGHAVVGDSDPGNARVKGGRRCTAPVVGHRGSSEDCQVARLLRNARLASSKRHRRRAT
jgi:hypothetical protein